MSGKPYFAILDAAVADEWQAIYHEIHCCFSGDETVITTVFGSYFTPQFPDADFGEYVQFSVQNDTKSCSRYALMHANDVAKKSVLKVLIPLITSGADCLKRWKQESFPTLYVLPFDKLPVELAFILKFMQSKTAFEKLPSNLRSALVNKNETLEMYWDKHGVNQEGRPKGINLKLETYKKK